MYTPEVGIDLDLLRTDVKFLKTRYRLDVPGKNEGRLVLRSVSLPSIFSYQLTYPTGAKKLPRFTPAT